MDGKASVSDEIRAVEDAAGDIHFVLCEWGQWANQGRYGQGCTSPGISSMAGRYEQERDPEAAPEECRPAFNERRMQEVDNRIHNAEFPAIWRRVLKANYVPAQFLACVLPEYQRPPSVPCSLTMYLSSLEAALERLMDQ